MKTIVLALDRAQADTPMESPDVVQPGAAARGSVLLFNLFRYLTFRSGAACLTAGWW